jgi:hypothetical protein
LASATSSPVAAGPLANLPARLQALDVPGKLGRSRRRDALRDRHMIETPLSISSGSVDLGSGEDEGANRMTLAATCHIPGRAVVERDACQRKVRMERLLTDRGQNQDRCVINQDRSQLLTTTPHT